MAKHIISFLLFLLLPLLANAQKHEISPDEQARIIETRRASYTALVGEGDTVTFQVVLELPDATESVIYNRCVEALQRQFYTGFICRSEDKALHRVLINTRLLRDNSIVKEGIVVGRSSIQQTVNAFVLVQVKPGRCRITLAFTSLCVDSGNSAGWYRISTFYPMAQNVKPENRLTSWRNISWAYDEAQYTIDCLVRSIESTIYDDQW